MKDITDEQKRNSEFFDSMLKKWLDNVAYKEKFVVISSQEIKAVFDRGADAYRHAMSNLTPGEFIIREVISQEDSIAYLPSVFS